MTAPQDDARTALPGIGARIVALVGAISAVLAMSLPWASEDNTLTEDFSEPLLIRGGVRWTGWGLHGASRLDGHRPITLITAMILITGTVALALAAWVAFERAQRRWLAPTAAAVALALLIASFPGLESINGRTGAEHLTTTEFGVVVWRLAILTVLLGTTRLALLQEAARKR